MISDVNNKDSKVSEVKTLTNLRVAILRQQFVDYEIVAGRHLGQACVVQSIVLLVELTNYIW